MKKIKKVWLSCLAIAALVCTFVVNSFAASELPSAVVTGFTTGIGSIKDSIFEIIGIAFPVALTVVGVVVAIKFGKKFVLSLIGR